MANQIDTVVDRYLKDKCVLYRATFKPDAQPDAKKPSDLQIKWTIQIGDTTFEYFAGIGHLPENAKPPESATVREGGLDSIMKNFRQVVCNGLHYKTGKPWHLEPAAQPTAASVLYCVLSDAEAIDYPTFEEWAGTYGYDVDSRSAEKIYRACVESGLKLRRIFGDAGIAELRELLQDY